MQNGTEAELIWQYICELYNVATRDEVIRLLRL